MRHAKRGRKLGRTASHRKAMLNNMATSLFEHGSIRTTIPKAKELRGVAERLITFAKRGDLHARRQVLRRIRNKVIVSKLFDEIGPSFAERNGGYTRVLKMGVRRGDSTEICLIELVGDELRSEYAAQAVEESEPTSVAVNETETEEESAVAEDSTDDAATEDAEKSESGEAPASDVSAEDEEDIDGDEESSEEEKTDSSSSNSESGENEEQSKSFDDESEKGSGDDDSGEKEKA